MRDLKLSDFDASNVKLGPSHVSDGKWVLRKDCLTRRDQLIFATKDSVRMFHKAAVVTELADEKMASIFAPLEKLPLTATRTRLALRYGTRVVRVYLLDVPLGQPPKVVCFDERLLELCDSPSTLFGASMNGPWQEPTGGYAVMPYAVEGSIEPEEVAAARALAEVSRER